MTGAQTDRMTRDDGWRLLSIGRHIERLGFLASRAGARLRDRRGARRRRLRGRGGAVRQHHHLPCAIPAAPRHPGLLDLLVLDRDNPRSLGWVAQTLRGRIAKLAGSAAGRDAGRSRDRARPAAAGRSKRMCERDADGRYPRCWSCCSSAPTRPTSSRTTSARATSRTRATPRHSVGQPDHAAARHPRNPLRLFAAGEDGAAHGAPASR